jgi:hypothetical protein
MDVLSQRLDFVLACAVSQRNGLLASEALTLSGS